MINPQLLSPESIVVIGGSNNTHKPGGAIVRLSTLLRFATEIKEIDINPLLADADDITAVDARIRIEKHDAS